MSGTLGNSTQEQELLRAVAVWAADCAERALPLFESRHPTDTRPREAIEGGRAFGRGKKRDKHLRIVALAAFRAGKDVDEPSKYAARAASLTAAVAYTHTDLQTGRPGVRQARHVLGPAVYAALALETAEGGDSKVGDDVVRSYVFESNDRLVLTPAGSTNKLGKTLERTIACCRGALPVSTLLKPIFGPMPSVL